MIPYTREAIATIRISINNGTPADYVRQQLGWDASMFDRVCRQHGIEARSAPSTNAQGVAATSPRSDRIPTTVSLTADIVEKLDSLANALGMSRYEVGSHIVMQRVARGDLADIQRAPRVTYGTGTHAIAFGIEGDDWAALFAEAKRRGRERVTAGSLVKACIVRHFD